VRRSRIGSEHLHDDSDGISQNAPGPYLYDLNQGFIVSAINTTLTSAINGTSSRVIPVANSSQFPNSSGYLIFDYGCSTQEGPVPYIAAPSSTSLLISPSYTIQKPHSSGGSVMLVAQKSPVTLPADGTAYQGYLTDVVSGRTYAQDLIQSVVAAGVQLIITVLYPSDEGLGKAGTPESEITEIWSE
jgi:hypothetical protein